MDPVSIATGIGAVAKLAFDCSSTLYFFCSDAQQVDDNVRALHDEVRTLSKTAETIESVLRNPDIYSYHDFALWTDAEESLQACAGTLRRFQTKLRGLRGAGTSTGLTVENAVRQFKLNGRGEDLDRLRAQLHSHNLALHTILATINIHVASSGPAVVLAEIIPRMEALTRYVMSLEQDERLYSRRMSNEDESVIRRANSKLAQRAKVVISKASSVAGGARSTIYGSSSPNNEAASLYDGYQPSLSYSFDFGETLPLNFNAEQDTAGLLDSSISQSANDSDDDLDVEMAEQYVRLGNEALGQNDYVQAEAFFKKALTQPVLLTKISAPVTVSSLQIKLAWMQLQQGKDLDIAKIIVERIVHSNIKTDQDRKTVLDAAHVLAQIHFALGSLSEARVMCRRTIDGRRRFEGKTQQYYEAIALMSKICEAQGDNIDSMTFAKLLPVDFQFPKFTSGAMRSIAKGESLGSDTIVSPDVSLSSLSSSSPSSTGASDTGLRLVRGASSDKFQQYLAESKFITLPIPESEFQDQQNVASDTVSVMTTGGRRGRLQSIAGLLRKISISNTDEPVRMVRMSREEYDKYWRRDSSGVYIGTEPEGSGRERMRQALAGKQAMSLHESRREDGSSPRRCEDSSRFTCRQHFNSLEHLFLAMDSCYTCLDCNPKLESVPTPRRICPCPVEFQQHQDQGHPFSIWDELPDTASRS